MVGLGPKVQFFKKITWQFAKFTTLLGPQTWRRQVPKNKLSKKESRHHCHVDILVGQFLVFQQKFYPDKNSFWACHNQMKDMKKGRKYYDYYESKQGHKILL